MPGRWRTFLVVALAVATHGVLQMCLVRAARPRRPSQVPPTGLRLADPCLDPFMVKVRAELPTAFYNHGMAWPSHHDDSACPAAWPERYARNLEELGSVAYTSSDGASRRLHLWRLRPGRPLAGCRSHRDRAGVKPPIAA